MKQSCTCIRSTREKERKKKQQINEADRNRQEAYDSQKGTLIPLVYAIPVAPEKVRFFY